jgi:hypothetical protein
MSIKVVSLASVFLVIVFVVRESAKDRSVIRVDLTEVESGEARKDEASAKQRAQELRKAANTASKNDDVRAKTRQEAHRAFLKATTDAYPLQPVKDRLPRRAGTAKTELSSKADADLKELETADHGSFNRSWALKDVHQEAVKKFSETEGQGVRRIPIFSKEMIDSLKRSDEVPLQPEIVGTTVAEPAATAAGIDDALKTFHRAGIGDFASPQDFGYVTDDGKRAAGFVPHRFTKTPPADPRLRLKRIDLVGLLLHPKPVVYVSDKLPRMEELTAAPTRSPDDFEAKAMESLQKGAPLVVRETETGLRMVGAIRAATQCTACHGVQRGELLGAFSYRFEQP